MTGVVRPTERAGAPLDRVAVDETARALLDSVPPAPCDLCSNMSPGLRLLLGRPEVPPPADWHALWSHECPKHGPHVRPLLVCSPCRAAVDVRADWTCINGVPGAYIADELGPWAPLRVPSC